MFEFIKKLLGLSKKEPFYPRVYTPEFFKRLKEGRPEKEDIRKLDEYLEQVGKLKAEVKKKDEIIKKLEEKVTKEGFAEKLKDIEERRSQLKKERLRKYILFGKEFQGKVKVFSRDHRFLGYFYSFGMSGGTDGGSWIVNVTPKPGSKKVWMVWEAKSLDGLIHRSENAHDTMRNGVLILNRDWAGNFHPDLVDYLPLLGTTEVKCMCCGEKFDTEDELKKHLKKHEVAG